MESRRIVYPVVNYSEYVLKRFIQYSLLLVLLLPLSVNAVDVTNTNVQAANGELGELLVSWDAFGQRWHAVVSKDKQLGDEIVIIDVAVNSGNEQFNRVQPNCYYRGRLADDSFNPTPDTHAFINLCNPDVPFLGFVSNQFNVYAFARSDTTAGITMTIDNQNQAVPYEGISPYQGEENTDIPDGLYPRKGNASFFPSIEIAVEPAYVQKYGEFVFIDRIVEALAFANFIFEQSGMKPLSLIAISLLDQNIIWSGGAGNVRGNIYDLRLSTVQTTSADMLLVYMGSSINTTNTWGWANRGYACELQRAVVEELSVNTVNVGRSIGFVTPVPSLIQRGWLLMHEIGHLLDSRHVKQDSVMDARFQYLSALVDYKASCRATQQMFESCAFDPKTWNFNDFYNCN